MTSRAIIALALGACLGAGAPAAHAAQPDAGADWPTRKAITMIVPFAAGGSTDATARLLAEHLSRQLKQQVVVENRAGAGSNLGSSVAARATPDGYTLLLATSTIATNVTLYKNMGFDLRRDLIPVSQIASIPNVLTVNNNVPAKSLTEFIALVQKKDAPVNYGSAGNGSASHLSGALFNAMAKGDMVHVAYKGGAPANVDLMGGQVQAVFSPLVEVLSYLESGKLRALGVTTPERSPRLPDVPAVGESLPGFDVSLWNGVFVPAGTPPAVVDKLAQALKSVTQDPAFRKVLLDQGSAPTSQSPAQFKAFLDQEIDKWAKLVKLSGATVD
ncbi:tripartite tricarboxylate transporter substrate binding protein [Achromobacter sp. ACM05]|uniref:Bug family tripartite tricarboxylate transporter substrate binding protein n=1 Tax=Achromobacter sp. ACM05 TaxID=2854776 RepID=UPI001C43ED39|nr:tripartite tricarboxylate transporter substrate binding protein [Achromobacter sp. ACM05]MBV7501585.1 tripartite tricarboxylate transporter substrate binding protein [Achromobacter sp. ACM05]